MSIFKNIKEVIKNDETLKIDPKIQLIIILLYFALVGYAIYDAVKERRTLPQNVPLVFSVQGVSDSVLSSITVGVIKIASIDQLDGRTLSIKTIKKPKTLKDTIYLSVDDMEYLNTSYALFFKIYSLKYAVSPQTFYYYIDHNPFAIMEVDSTTTLGIRTVRLKKRKEKPETLIIYASATVGYDSLTHSPSINFTFQNATLEFPKAVLPEFAPSPFTVESIYDEEKRKMRNPVQAMIEVIKEEKEKQKAREIVSDLGGL